jgi:hypothetical protein
MEKNLAPNEARELLARLAKRKGLHVPQGEFDVKATAPQILDYWYSADEIQTLLRVQGWSAPANRAKTKRQGSAARGAATRSLRAAAMTKPLRREIVRVLSRELPPERSLAVLRTLASRRGYPLPTAETDLAGYTGIFLAEAFNPGELRALASYLASDVGIQEHRVDGAARPQ